MLLDLFPLQCCLYLLAKLTCFFHWNTGDNQIVKTTPAVTGQLWQDLFSLWVSWGRIEWLHLGGMSSHDVSHTFIDLSGEPFHSSEYITGKNMSAWLKPTFMDVCKDSDHFTAGELTMLTGFTVQVSRFSYIQMMEKALKSSKSISATEVETRKKDICRCMLTTTREWDTYASRRDHTGDMEETATWLRSNGFVV